MANTLEKSTLGHRIKELMFRLNKNQSSFAESIGYSQTSVYNTINDKTKPGSEMLAKILEIYPAVNEKWLVQGEGEMFSKDARTETSNRQVEQPEKLDYSNNDGGTMLQLLKEQYEKRIAELSSALQDARYTIGLQKKILETGNFNDPTTGETEVIRMYTDAELHEIQNPKKLAIC